MKSKQILSPLAFDRKEKVNKILLIASSCRYADQQAEELSNPKRKRSMHYCIDDHQIIEVVPEEKLALATQLSRLDEGSISICVCTSGIPFLTFSEGTQAKIVELCADICKRNELPASAIETYYGGAYLNTILPKIIRLVEEKLAKKSKRKEKAK